MKEHFIKLFKYNLWANQIVCKSVFDNKLKDESLVKIISHIYDSEVVWYNRITDAEGSPGIWESQELTQLPGLFETIDNKLIAYIDNLDEEAVPKLIAYENSKGQKFISRLTDILTHLANHGTYHRGQIAKMIRNAGDEPPVTDYIAFVRKQ